MSVTDPRVYKEGRFVSLDPSRPLSIDTFLPTPSCYSLYPMSARLCNLDSPYASYLENNGCMPLKCAVYATVLQRCYSDDVGQLQHARHHTLPGRLGPTSAHAFVFSLYPTLSLALFLSNRESCLSGSSMSARKRRLSTDSPPKRTKKHTAIPVDDDEGAESLDSILARIKALEESEQLARRLQDEWEASVPELPSTRVPSGSTSRSYTTPENPIEISDGEDEQEDDEAMARRLTREWEMEDGMDMDVDAEVGRPPSYSSPSKGKGKSTSDVKEPSVLPVSKLEEHRDLFVGEKTCQCGAELHSPRGHVRV